jgi:hypothetical protein
MTAATTSTALPSQSLEGSSVRVRDHMFYMAMAAVMALIVFIGFGPTYYFKLLTGGPTATFGGRPFTLLVHVHGALFTVWVLFFMTQTALVAQRRVRAHRKLGVVGAVLAVSMVVAGLAMIRPRTGVALPEARIATLIVPFFEMVMFVAFITLAFVLRRDPESHKRLVLLANASILEAAIGRLPGVQSLAAMVGHLPGARPWFASCGLAFLYVVTGIAYDVISRRRVHPVYIFGGAFLALMTPIRLILSTTAAWRAFVGLFIG